MYEIDRKTASRMLKVSMRTVDRYIRSGKLSTEVRDGRVWLDKSDIIKIKGVKVADSKDAYVDRGVSIDSGVRNVHVDSMDSGDTVSTSSPPARGVEERVYQKLYEELREEVKAKQDRLEGANYRVGQLEAMLKDSVPLLEHQKMLQIEQGQLSELKQSFDPLRLENQQLNDKVKEEKLNKKIYLIILFIIMLLQPLWLFLSIYKK